MERYREAWNILKEVDAELSKETDSKGDLKGSGEGRALWRMKGQLQREIARDADTILGRAGYGRGGQKRKQR